MVTAVLETRNLTFRASGWTPIHARIVMGQAWDTHRLEHPGSVEWPVAAATFPLRFDELNHLPAGCFLITRKPTPTDL